MKQDPLTQRRLYPEESLLRELQRGVHLTIGIPCENPVSETRLPLTPEGVAIVVEEGHTVMVERGAGLPMSYTDLHYSESGAIIVDSPAEVFSADIVLKIAPPSHEELLLMKPGRTVFSMLQLSNISTETLKLMASKKLNAIAYELIKDEQKAFPVINTLAELEGSSAIAVASELLSNEIGRAHV